MPRLMPDADESQREAVVTEYRASNGECGWSKTSLYSGVHEMLSALTHAGWKLFICASKREDFALKILERLELSRSFVALYGDVQGSKNHNKTDLLARLIEEQHLVSDRCYMIGDGLSMSR
jgi:phosphoglycolate phosphatase